MQVVLLPVGKDVYAVLTDWVREVVTAPPLTPLATGPELLTGPVIPAVRGTQSWNAFF